MLDVSIRFSDGVDEAARLVARYVSGKREAEGRGTQAAICSVAREARVGQAVVRRLYQPSERPKSVCINAWRRLAGAYVAFLRRRLTELETEIVRVEAIARADDGAVRDLLDEARALTARIEELL